MSACSTVTTVSESNAADQNGISGGKVTALFFAGVIGYTLIIKGNIFPQFTKFIHDRQRSLGLIECRPQKITNDSIANILIPKNENFYCVYDFPKKLQELIKYCERYIDDSKYVYKRCGDHIIVMKKMYDTKTNENREDIIDLRFAKCRADKLFVKEIIDLNVRSDFLTTVGNLNHTVTIFGVNKHIDYVVEQIVVPDLYDEDISIVCGGGIHYFNNIISAYFYYTYDDHELYHELYLKWNDDGRFRTAFINRETIDSFPMLCNDKALLCEFCNKK